MMGKALSVSLAVAALLTTVAANAQPTLTGIVVFSTDSRGSASGGAVWDTLAGGHWNLYVIQGAPGGTFVNSGDSGTTSISIPLATGAKAFTLQGAGTAQAVIPGDSNQPVSYMGLNLFFDGDDGNPKISVFGALGVAGGTVTGGTTYALGGKTVTGANTLSFVTSVYRVTLSDFLFQPNVAGSDRVRPYKSIPDQVDDNLVTFTLTVERLPPVPGTSRWPVIAALALLTAFAGLIALRRWRAPAGSDRMPIRRLMRAIRVLQPEPMKLGFFLLLVTVAMGAWILFPYHFGRPSPPRLVLLYAPCTVNRRFLSPYNGAVEYTPHLDRFAARAVVFDRHQTEAAQSGVAYASLFSGTQADRHGIYKHPTKLADGVYLAAEAFSGAGYETFFWSVHPMVSPALNYGQGVPATNTYTDNGSPGRFLRASDPVFRALLDGLKSDRSRRAFVMTNFMVTHGPYTAEHLVDFCHAHAQDCPVGDPAEKRKFLAAFNDHYHEWSYDFDGTKSRLGFDDADTARFIAFVEMLYKSNVWYLDSLFGALVNEIEQRDLLDESLIVFTTDHGEVLFRDNAPYKWTHGFSLAPEELEIPLIVRWPRGTQGRYGGVTRSIDVFPTLAGLSDVEMRNGEVDGEDLTAALLGKAQPDLLAFSHTALLPDLFMTQMNPRFPSLNKPFPRQEPQLMWVQVRQRDLVYKIANRDGSKFEAEVYDHSIDPDERGNLYDANDPEQRDMFEKLNAYKQRLIEGYGRLKADVEGRLPTERQQEILRSLGYIP